MLQTPDVPNGVPEIRLTAALPAREFAAVAIKMAQDTVRALGLAGVVEDIGSSCSASDAAFQDIVQKFSSLNEDDIAKVLAVVARSTGNSAESSQTTLNGMQENAQSTDGSRTWNLDVVIPALKAAVQELDPRAVASAFDHPGFFIPNAKAFVTLMESWRKLTTEPYPLDTLLRSPWGNITGQLSFLSHAVVAPPELFTFEHAEARLATIESPSGSRLGVGTANGAWMSLALYQLLASASTAGYGSVVVQILEQPAKSCPQVLLVGMCATKQDWGSVLTDIYDKLIPQYIMDPGSEALLQRMWAENADMVIRGMIVTLEQRPGSTPHILRVCHKLEAFLPLLHTLPFSPAMEIAISAEAEEGTSVLEEWLFGRLSTNSSFVQVLADNVLSRPLYGTPSETQPQGPRPLEPNVLIKVLRQLEGRDKLVPFELANRLKQFKAQAMFSVPGMQISTVEIGALSRVPLAHRPFTEAVEALAVQHFQKFYAENEPPEALLATLKKLKLSTSSDDNECLKCVVQTMFDETRFFPNYPDTERNLTATLNTGLIRDDLLEDFTLGEAFRLLLHAASGVQGDLLFEFACKVLKAVSSKLLPYTRVRQHLLQIAELRGKEPELVQALESGLLAPNDALGNGPPGFGNATSKDIGVMESTMGVQVAEQALAEPTAPKAKPEDPAGGAGATRMQQSPGGPPKEGQTSTPFGTAAVQATKLPGQSRLPGGSNEGVAAALSAASASEDPKHRAFHSVNPEILELASQDQELQAPPMKVQDKIGFMINNLTSASINEKAKELKGMLLEEHWGWFCTYIVIKRSAQEPNFQHLYEGLIAALEEKELWRMMVSTTYKYVKVLLSSPTIASNYSERTLLKSLGSWLGRLTMAKGQPIRHKDLDLKGIILDAYENGKMIAILGFINKVLECCKESRVFKASNPYIAAILSLMAEIYVTPKLKLNLSFEIEMLFKSFGMTISDVRVSKELVNRKRDTVSGVDYTLDKPAGEASIMGSLPPPSPAKSVLGGPESARGQPPSIGRPPLSATSHLSVEPTDPSQAASQVLHSPVRDAAMATQQHQADREIITNLHNLVVINPSLQHLSERLKRIVPTAVDRAVAEIIGPVVDRSVQIACVSTESLIQRDYAYEEDESKMRQSAHLMASTVAGCMAVVTCKELLRSSLANSLRNYLSSDLDPSQLEGVVQMITTDNIDLGCSCIEKATIDKAIRDINERLAPAFKARQAAAAAGQPFVNLAELKARLPEALPESLAPKSQWLSPQQQRVYEDFARIPKAAPTASATAQQSTTTDKGAMERSAYDEPLPTAGFPHLMEAVLHWQHRLEVLCSSTPQAVYQRDGGELTLLVNEILAICTEGNDDHAMYAARKIFARTFEVSSSLFVTSSIAALSQLKAHATSQNVLVADITQTWANMATESKWRKDICEGFIRAGLLSLAEFDTQVYKKISSKQGVHNVVDCALHMMRSLVLSTDPVASGSDFYNSIEAIQKLVIPQLQPQVAATIQPILDQTRRITNLSSHKPGDSLDIPVEIKAKIKQVLDDWLRVSEEIPDENNHAEFVARLQAMGFLKGDENTDMFFKGLFSLAVASSLAVEPPPSSMPKALNYLPLDASVRLCLLLINCHSGGLVLLRRVLTNLVVCLQREANFRGEDFNGRPYYRILLGFVMEAAKAEGINPSSYDHLTAIATSLLNLQPLQVPGFAFQWLELVSMRTFMPRLVGEPRGWPFFQKLLISLLHFLEPYLRQAEMSESVRLLYKGTLRVLLVLLHDFPEFLCEFHFEVCNAVPPSCIQMRNLILSAFPRNMRLPDPFTPNLKVDLLPEIGTPPMFREPSEELLSKQIRQEVDTYLRTRQMSPFLANVRSSFALSPQEATSQDTRYDVPLLNAFVFYVGVKEIAMKAPKPPGPDSVGTDIFVKMTDEMDTEGRYLFLNALANQLRYPNNHTHYFSCVILNLFHDAKEEIIQEQITRVLLERLIVNRPHPWGLLITFIELIKNPHYCFWDHKFTHCAGEIERLFDSVARSCMNSNNAPPKKEEGLQGAQRALIS